MHLDINDAMTFRDAIVLLYQMQCWRLDKMISLCYQMAAKVTGRNKKIPRVRKHMAKEADH